MDKTGLSSAGTCIKMSRDNSQVCLSEETLETLGWFSSMFVGLCLLDSSVPLRMASQPGVLRFPCWAFTKPTTKENLVYATVLSATLGWGDILFLSIKDKESRKVCSLICWDNRC